MVQCNWAVGDNFNQYDSATVYEKNSMKKYKWAVIGPGKIAHKFVKDLLLLPNAELYAVASRSEENAKNFADRR